MHFARSPHLFGRFSASDARRSLSVLPNNLLRGIRQSFVIPSQADACARQSFRGSLHVSRSVQTIRHIQSMRGAQAIIALIFLLGTSFPLLPSLPCCEQPGCCSGGYCALSAKHSPQKSGAERMPCHHSSPDGENSAMKSACGHTSQSGVISLLPQAILEAAVTFQTPAASRQDLFPLSSRALSGFESAMLEPPRH